MSAQGGPRRSEPRAWRALAVSLWAVSFAGVALLVVSHRVHVDVWAVYAAAGQRWLARAPLYDTTSIDQFQYFPHAAIVFGALGRLGSPLDELVWRALGWALFGHAIWRMSLLAAPERASRLFFVASALVILPALTSLKNGQANLYVAALMVHAAVDLARQRRGRVILWLALGLAIKPLMGVMLLVVCVYDRALAWRAAVAVAVLLVLPAALAPIGYAAAQERAALSKLAVSAQPDRMFEDLRGLLWTLGLRVAPSVLFAARLVAALGVALACARLRGRWREPAASLLLLALAAVYLMLFNPRTQANSYVIVAPVAALAGASFLLDRRWGGALAMMAMIAAWSGSSTPLTAFWLKPLTCAIFGVLLLRELFDADRTGSRPTSLGGVS